jgi:hypothetical protein
LTEELLTVLDRIADELHASNEWQKRHYSLFKAEYKKQDERHAVAEQRYATEKRIQTEYLNRNRKVTKGTLEALDRQAFDHEIRLANLGLRVPDTIPPDIEETP